MNYTRIKALLNQPKQSHRNESTKYQVYGNFAVCKDSRGYYFLIDTKYIPQIVPRLWCRSHGYPCTRLDDEVVRLHDCIMALRYGEKPDENYVDHINQDKSDNRITNLRFVTPSVSATNMPLRSDNTSGAKGVSKTKAGKYRAYITVNHKQKSLGQYDTLEEAAEARKNGERLYGYMEETPNQ